MIIIENDSISSLRNSLYPLFEGTRYDKQAAKIISDSGLFSEEVSENIIDALFSEDIHAFVRSPNWLEKYLKGIARMLVDEADGDVNKAQEFLRKCPAVFNQYLTYVKKNRDKLGGLELDNRFINQMSYEDVKNELSRINSELKKQSDEELSKMKFGKSSSYELVPIYSYDKFHSKFGGSATGDGSSDKYAGGGGTAWCHANSKSVYDDWIEDNTRMFFVLANKNWKDIPFDEDSNEQNPKDDYGNSLIAILVDIETGDLLNATLRCNHIGVSSNADNQYDTYAELSKIAGFNVEDAVHQEMESAQEHAKQELAAELRKYGIDENGVYHYTGGSRIPDSVRKAVQEVIIEDGVTRINDYAFSACTSLKSITIPDSVTYIGDDAFSACTSLKSITIPDSVTEIGDDAFWNCNSLKSVTIPDSVTYIGRAFEYCTNLSSITIPNGVKSIGQYAFYYCESLASVTIPDSVTRIGEKAFYYCTSLTSITIPDSVTDIGDYAFCDCKSLKSITIPESVTEIGYCVFAFCTSLTSITIPNSVTEIDYGAFEYCDNLTVYCPPNSYAEKYCIGNDIPYSNDI